MASWDDLAGFNAILGQQMLGGLGQGLQQRLINPQRAMNGNILNRRRLLREAPTLSFFDKLRNEIDEWLKL